MGGRQGEPPSKTMQSKAAAIIPMSCIMFGFFLLGSYASQAQAHTRHRRTSRKIKESFSERETVTRLRWDLISTKITLDQAARLLLIKIDSVADTLYRSLINLSQDARHIYDPKSDKEFVVFLHSKRDFVAVYETTPLYQDHNLGYTVMRSAEFFDKFVDLDHLIVEKYRRIVATRRIQRSPFFRNWMEKPTTKDGKLGITCRLSLKATRALMGGDDFPDHQPSFAA